MPGSIRVRQIEPVSFIRGYGWGGGVQAAVWPFIWALFMSQLEIIFTWWAHLVAIPCAFILSGVCTAQANGIAFDDVLQREAQKQFLRWYWKIHPWAIGAVAVRGLYLNMMS